MDVAPDPDREFAAHVAAELSRAGHLALFAGGCVRDRLLGKVPKDYDVATDAVPARVREIFGRRRTLAVGEAFGVIVVLPDKRRFPAAQQVEVATFREDAGYADGRRPDAVTFSTPEKDAARRDFTINGLFEDPATGEVIDHVGGVADLEARVLRAIGDPASRMAEDALRMLRFVRFATALDFRPDERTGEAVKAAADRIVHVSGERVGQEMRKLLASERRAFGVGYLHAVGLDRHVAPAFAALSPARRDQTRGTLKRLGQTTFFPLALAAMYWDVGDAEEAVDRWRLSNGVARKTWWLLENRHGLTGFADLPTHRKKRLLGEPGGADLVRLVRARASALKSLADAGEEVDARIKDADAAAAFLRDTPPADLAPPPLLTGRDLIAAGLRPGPDFKRRLYAAYDAQLDGRVTTTEEALGLVR